MNLSDALARIEDAAALDGLSRKLQTAIKNLSNNPLGSALRGDWLGHPAHPMLIAVPIGAWLGASVLDAAGENVAARRMVGIGLASVPAVVLTGWVDWSALDDRQRRVGLVHAFSNASGVVLMGNSHRLRRGDPTSTTAKVLTLLGNSLIGLGGALGGYLVYNQGAGVHRSVDASAAVGPEFDSRQLPNAVEQASRR